MTSSGGERAERANAPERAFLAAIDRRLGITRKTFSWFWWAAALWNAAAVFNVWSRTQRWGFALPVAPDFEKSATPYGVAAFGGIAGAVILCGLLYALRFYARTWGACSSHWIGRVPAFGVRTYLAGTLLPFLVAAGLLISVAFPLAGQVHFLDKFLAGTSQNLNGGEYAHEWGGHLLKPLSLPAACKNYKYDGSDGLAYCEFYEPWAACLLALATFIMAVWASFAVFGRKSPEH